MAYCSDVEVSLQSVKSAAMVIDDAKLINMHF